VASLTPNIGLYKKDPVADANDYFNITTMLNNNWDALDSNQGSLAALRTALGLTNSATLAQILTAINGKIAAGSYTGTGTHGSGNTNSLTFSFAPKLIIIICTATSYAHMMVMIPSACGFGISTTSSGNAASNMIDGYIWLATSSTSGGGKTVSWYSSIGDRQQMNVSGNSYYYVAIG